MLLARFIVEENLPFSILDKQRGRERPFTEYATFIRPGISVSSGHGMRKLVEKYFNVLLERVKSEIRNHMDRGYGTLMFDSSEDFHGSPMTNMLIRIMGLSRSNIRTFLLCTFYTGAERCDAQHYIKMAEEVIRQ